MGSKIITSPPMDEKALLEILECKEINNETIIKICEDLEINFQGKETNQVLLFKYLEKSLIDHYRDHLEVDISDKFYSKKEILGLLVFLKVRNRKIEVYEKLEEFFDFLFFSRSESIKSLKEENEKLKEELNSKTFDLNETFVNVDYEVLKNLEAENVKLRGVIQKENDVVIKAWFNLCEEHIKNNL